MAVQLRFVRSRPASASAPRLARRLAHVALTLLSAAAYGSAVAGTITFQGTDAAETITLSTGASAGDGQFRIVSSTQGTFDFVANGPLTINGGITANDAGDTIVLNLADIPANLTSV